MQLVPRLLTANKSSNLKDDDGSEDDRFEGKICVRFAPQLSKASNSEKEGRPVPANVVEAVELSRDTGYSCGNNVLELSEWYII
jgi:hypothetical protein